MLLLLFVLTQYCNTLHVLNLSAVPVYFVQRLGSTTQLLQLISSLPFTLMLIYVVRTSIPIPGWPSLYHVWSFFAHVAVSSSPALRVKLFTKLLMTFVYWSNVLAVPVSLSTPSVFFSITLPFNRMLPSGSA